MFYFKLYEDSRFRNVKHFEKVKLVNKAVKLYRKDHPINVIQRVLSILLCCVIPPLAIYAIFDVNVIIGWVAVSIFVLNVVQGNMETPKVKLYLDQVLSKET